LIPILFYSLTFTYTDGSESNITINLPTTAQWFQGESVPTNVADSKDGDYYFDTQGGTIYRKENGIWVAKATIPTDTTPSPPTGTKRKS